MPDELSAAVQGKETVGLAACVPAGVPVQLPPISTAPRACMRCSSPPDIVMDAPALTSAAAHHNDTSRQAFLLPAPTPAPPATSISALLALPRFRRMQPLLTPLPDALLNPVLSAAAPVVAMIKVHTASAAE